MKKIILFLFITIMALNVFAKETVKLAYANWAEGIAMTNLAKVILEDEMGYDVETTMADPGLIFVSLAQGNQDAFLDAWLPITHEAYIKQFGDKLTDLGYNFEGARIGLVVPEYVNINSIEELNNSKDKFDSQIVGIDAGAGIMSTTYSAIDAYDLDLELIESSGPVMTASLANAIDKKEWIVVTGWQPHWKFARFALKFLDDPKEVYGKAENLHTMARRNFIIDMPEVAQFLTHFYLNSQQLGSLMDMISNSDDAEDAAREWIKQNKKVVENWIPNN
ncbi:glycine betaine ABC transporter substrate-binding protein [Oceanotoga sp. DSM 15011]|nr:glycine betaine ABC transporter substrate-binding protein [Oceanotoga sp. DSM 15011]UYP00360.1 glycine betaine ABC transporter substrate-binding protein [Oceanotoga sp. DSM 15011]